MKTDSQFIKELNHWHRVMNKYNKLMTKRPMTRDEYQQMYLAESKIEELTESVRHERINKLC